MPKADIRSRFIKPNLDPQKLSHFLAVYDTGNFSSAAKANDVTQQAVSKSIARLEEILAVTLFDRGTMGAEPTIFAHALARRAKIIIAESRLAAAELTALRGADQGYVRIGLGWSFLPRIAPSIINSFTQKYPDVTVSVVTGDSRTLFQKLMQGDVEFVASAPPAEMDIDDTIDIKPLFIDTDALTMRKGHPLTQKDEITLKDLSQQKWLISTKLSEQWQRISSIFLANGMSPPKNFVDLESVALVKAMILQSDALAMLSKELVSLEYENGQFHFHDATDFAIKRTAYLVTRKNSSLQPLANSLQQELLTACRKFVDTETWVAGGEL